MAAYATSGSEPFRIKTASSNLMELAVFSRVSRTFRKNGKRAPQAAIATPVSSDIGRRILSPVEWSQEDICVSCICLTWICVFLFQAFYKLVNIISKAER